MTERFRLPCLPLALCLFLTGCGDMLAPYEGIPRVAPVGVVDEGPRIAVCYNALFATPEGVRRVAEEACGSGTIPKPIGQDMRLNCPLLTPVRANFVCTPD
jgi:hypothetical protein